MLSEMYRDNSAAMAKLKDLVVTQDELHRFYHGIDYVESDRTRYCASYEEGLAAAQKLVAQLEEREIDKQAFRSAVEECSGKLGWMSGIFCRMCLRFNGKVEVVEMDDYQVYVFGCLADKASQTMYINESYCASVDQISIEELLDKAERFHNCVYVRFCSDKEFMNEPEANVRPPRAVLRTQLSLFIEREAYENLCKKERINFVSFIKSVSGIFVVMAPKERPRIVRSAVTGKYRVVKT